MPATRAPRSTGAPASRRPGYIEYGTGTGYGQQTATDTTLQRRAQRDAGGADDRRRFTITASTTRTAATPSSRRTKPSLPAACSSRIWRSPGRACPASFAPLDTINLAWTVLNTGPGDAIGNWTDTVYLSTRTRLDVTATKLGDFPSVSPPGLRQLHAEPERHHPARPRRQVLPDHSGQQRQHPAGDHDHRQYLGVPVRSRPCKTWW